MAGDPRADGQMPQVVPADDAAVEEAVLDFSGEIGEQQGLKYFRIEKSETDEILFRARDNKEEKIEVPHARHLVQFAAGAQRGKMTIEEYVIAYAMYKKEGAGQEPSEADKGYAALVEKYGAIVSLEDSQRMANIAEKAREANIDWKKVEESISRMHA